jgi:Ca2+-binding RTX toxin-like protein
VLVVGSTTFNSTVAFNNIDALSIAAGQDATISTAQLATLPTVSGGSGSTLTVNVTAATYTLPSSQGYSGVAVRVVGDGSDQFITGWTGDESIQGLGGNDTLVGDTGNDTLSGGVGNDSVIGGLGNDVFVFGGTSEVTSGETVDGTSGTDTLLVTASTDLTGLVMANIDGVSIASGQTATFTGAQVTGQSWTVTGVAGGQEEVLAVNAAANATVNLSTIFTAVTNASIALNGNTGNEVLTGSLGSDTITGGLGIDVMAGGDGNDTFVYNGTPDTAVGETVNGGDGTDTVRLASNTNLTSVAFTNVEAFSLADGAALTLTAAQVAGQTWAINGTAGGGTEALNVTAATGGSASLASLTGLANLSINLNGALGAETLTGSSAADTIAASDGADSVLGGGGADSLSAGADADTVIGGAGSDTLSGGIGSDRFVFATGDASSTTLATLEVITDFVAADDAIALGVTGVLMTGTALDYATALTTATGVITGGTSDIIAIDTGTNTFVFADTNGDNVLDTVIQLTGTLLGLTSGDFVA